MNDHDAIKELEQQIADLKRRNEQLEQTVSGKPKQSKWREYSSRTLLILSLLVLIPASILVWLNRTLIDPTSYINAVGPIIQQPAVQKAISTSATNTLLQNVNVSHIVSQYLPPQAQFLAGPITSQVTSYAGTAVAAIVASPQFYHIWITSNEKAHSVFIQVANANRTSPTIDLNSVYKFISTQLQNTALAPLLNKQLPSNIGDIQVASVPALVKVPHYVNELSTWRWVLIAVAVALAGLAVWLARDKRKALIGVGVIWMISALITLVIVRVSRAYLEAQISNSTNLAAATAIWKTVLTSFYVELAVIFVLGLITVLAGLALGPGKVAVGIRTRSQHLLASGRLRWFPTAEHTRTVHFLQSHRRQGEWIILCLALLALLALVPLTIGTVVAVLIVTIIAYLIFEFFAVPKPSTQHTSG